MSGFRDWFNAKIDYACDEALAETAFDAGTDTELNRLLRLAEEMAVEAGGKRAGLRKQSTASQDLRVTAEALREFIDRAKETP